MAGFPNPPANRSGMSSPFRPTNPSHPRRSRSSSTDALYLAATLLLVGSASLLISQLAASSSSPPPPSDARIDPSKALPPAHQEGGGGGGGGGGLLGGTRSNEPRGKTTDQSTVQVTYSTTSQMCSSGNQALNDTERSSSNARSPPSSRRPNVRAGALLKLIDVVAGVTARKHAGFSCVTVSVDSVLLLRPIYLGELVHLSTSVNRAWGSSMEVGVRVVKEDPRTGEREYVSHSYLTFVAVAPGPGTGGPPPGVRLASRMTSETQLDHPSRITRFARLLGLKAASPPAPPKPKRPQLEPIIPRTPLEARRHILAGRRRAKRIDDAKRGEARDGVPTEVKRMVREQVLDMSRLVNRRRMSGDEQGGGNQFVEEVGHGGLETRPGEDPKIRIKPWDHEAWLKLKDEDQNHDPLTNPKRPGESRTTDQQQQQQQQQQQEQIEMLELEFVVRAYLEKDPAVKVFEEGGYVEVHLPGDVPLRQSLEKVRRLAEKVSSQTGMDQNQDRFGGGLSSSSPDGLDVAVVGRATSEQAPSVASPITQGDPPPPSPISPKEAPPPRKGRQRRRSIFSPPKEWTERETRLEAAVSTELIPPPPLDVSQTLVRTLHIVFPEHTNSVSVLFGGQLMDWMEEAALLSVRFVGRARRWNTVALDGLEFPQAVGVGEVMSFVAIVTRTFNQSCEVYVLAEAEAPNGTRRVTNDALFTLATSSSPDSSPPPPPLTKVDMRPGSALETFSLVADRRRQARLQLKDMLIRIYASP